MIVGTQQSTQFKRDSLGTGEKVEQALDTVYRTLPANTPSVRSLKGDARDDAFEAIRKPLEDFTGNMEDLEGLRQTFNTTAPARFADVIASLGSGLERVVKVWHVALDSLDDRVNSAIVRPNVESLVLLGEAVDAAEKVADLHPEWTARIGRMNNRLMDALKPLIVNRQPPAMTEGL